MLIVLPEGQLHRPLPPHLQALMSAGLAEVEYLQPKVGGPPSRLLYLDELVALRQRRQRQVMFEEHKRWWSAYLRATEVVEEAQAKSHVILGMDFGEPSQTIAAWFEQRPEGLRLISARPLSTPSPQVSLEPQPSSKQERRKAQAKGMREFTQRKGKGRTGVPSAHTSPRPSRPRR